jgi:hypothetical protein
LSRIAARRRQGASAPHGALALPSATLALELAHALAVASAFTRTRGALALGAITATRGGAVLGVDRIVFQARRRARGWLRIAQSATIVALLARGTARFDSAVARAFVVARARTLVVAARRAARLEAILAPRSRCALVWSSFTTR